MSYKLKGFLIQDKMFKFTRLSTKLVNFVYFKPLFLFDFTKIKTKC